MSGQASPALWLTSTMVLLLAGAGIRLAQQEPRSRSSHVPWPFPADWQEPELSGGRSATQHSDKWTAYGGSNLGRRFSPADQISPANVSELEKVWRFNTEDHPPTERVYYSCQNTPLKIDDSLYVCSSSNQVFALNPATGEQRWHFDPGVSPEAMEPLFSVTCRAVAYYEAPVQNSQIECPRRILLATQDSRLIALDEIRVHPVLALALKAP